MIVHRRIVAATLLAVLWALPVLRTGCRTAPPPEPEYARPLPPGAFGLRRVTDPARLPDLQPAAEQLRDPAFREALDRSLGWYQLPSSQQHFPSGPITHVHALTSAYAISQLADAAAGTDTLLDRLRTEFDVWESVGWDGRGTVFFTGYYTPVFRASRTRSAEFAYPLYQRPPDLVTDPVTGEVRGRQTSAGLQPFPTRAEIEGRNLLASLELVYLPSRLDAYLIHVNGSARLELVEGGTMTIGYAGNNGHDYTSIGRLLVADGKLDENRLSLAAIRDYFRQHPQELDGYIRQNDRFVFFREYDGANWPAGSLGFKVTPMRSLATDKQVFPRACVVVVALDDEPGFRQLMLDQDTGGAIRAAGRADIYMGIGDDAGRRAGAMTSEGRMYYLLLKREYVQRWYDQMMQASAPGAPTYD